MTTPTSLVLQLRGDGSAHVAGPGDDEEEHVVLGRLTLEPGRVRVRVNSQRRLKRLLRILQEIGAVPNVAEESRSEPSLDFAWGPVPGHGLTARQWAENWIGQAVAVLEFHTPRHAAEGSQADRLRLEGLLRQLEYQSALPAQQGGRPIDTAWLRAELGLESRSGLPAWRTIRPLGFLTTPRSVRGRVCPRRNPRT
jgi:hypothetical protein